MTVRLEWRDLEKIQCIASALLCGQGAVGDDVDFTDRYMAKEEEEEEVEEKVPHDSNISCYILAETGLAAYTAFTLTTYLCFKFLFLFIDSHQLYYFRTNLKIQ